MESPHGDPTTPGVARMRLPACLRLPAYACTRLPARPHTLACLGRQEGQPDTLSRTDSTRAAPAPPHPMPAFPACLPCPLAYPTPFPAMPACVILSTRAPHAHPAKRPFVKPFYPFPIYQNVTH